MLETFEELNVDGITVSVGLVVLLWVANVISSGMSLPDGKNPKLSDNESSFWAVLTKIWPWIIKLINYFF